MKSSSPDLRGYLRPALAPARQCVRVKSAHAPWSLTMSPRTVAGPVNAPELPAGLDWINTDRPLSLRELRGKIVMLDFWTFC